MWLVRLLCFAMPMWWFALLFFFWGGGASWRIFVLFGGVIFLFVYFFTLSLLSLLSLQSLLPHTPASHLTLQLHTSHLPIFEPHLLGFNGADVVAEWGQASSSLLAALGITEVRYYCKVQGENMGCLGLHFRSKKDWQVVDIFIEYWSWIQY